MPSKTKPSRLKLSILLWMIVSAVWGCSQDAGSRLVTGDTPPDGKGQPSASENGPHRIADMEPVLPSPLDFRCVPIPGGDKQISFRENLPGDYNNDGTTDGRDVFPLAVNFEAEVGEPGYSVRVDGNGDGILDGLDLFTIAVGFGLNLEGHVLFRSRFHDGQGAEEVLFIERDPIMSDDGYELTWHQPDFEPGFYFIRSRAPGDETPSGELSYVRPEEFFVGMDKNDDIVASNLAGGVLWTLLDVNVPGDNSALDTMILSVDGSTVFFKLDEEYFLVFITASGPNLEQLNLSDFPNPGQFSLKGDASELRFISRSPEGGDDLYVYSLDTSDFVPEQLFLHPHPDWIFLGWSADYSHAYGQRRELDPFRHLLEHFDADLILTDSWLGPPPSFGLSDIFVSGKGEQVYFTTWDIEDDESVFRFDLLDEEYDQITFGPGYRTEIDLKSTYEGDRIIFFGNWELDGENSGVYVLDSVGGSSWFIYYHTFMGLPVHNFFMSNDGLMVVYHRLTSLSGPGDTYVCDFQGQNHTLLDLELKRLWGFL